ncbi:MAG: (2Fe-2S)-binding protein [Negativicutes bacterium]|nr:(2Fe-2S)-binding protein [Negativicutes bacterium]
MVQCPDCGSPGQAVPRETVRRLVGADIPETENFGVCLTSSCDVVYFSLDRTFRQAEVRVPIAWKDGASPKYVCYCNRVTEDEIIRAVTEHGAKTVAEVAKATGAMKNGNCLVNNPKGTCCHTDIELIIKRG